METLQVEEASNNEIIPGLKELIECQTVLEKLPEGKVGIVIGAGNNTPKWRGRGWKTLDINLSTNPDIVADANNLEEALQGIQPDYYYCEDLTFDIYGQRGVQPTRLLQQANKTLPMNGKLIVKTANSVNSETSSLPYDDNFQVAGKNHGFRSTILKGELFSYAPEKYQQRVTYIFTKENENWDTSRTGFNEVGTRRNSIRR